MGGQSRQRFAMATSRSLSGETGALGPRILPLLAGHWAARRGVTRVLRLGLATRQLCCATVYLESRLLASRFASILPWGGGGRPYGPGPCDPRPQDCGHAVIHVMRIAERETERPHCPRTNPSAAQKNQVVDNHATTVPQERSIEWGPSVLEQDVEEAMALQASRCRKGLASPTSPVVCGPKKALCPLGSALHFVTERPRKRKLSKGDPCPMRARKMGYAVRRIESLQRNGENPVRANRLAANWQHVFWGTSHSFCRVCPSGAVSQ